MIDLVVLKQRISDVYYSVRRYILNDLKYAHKHFATGVKNLWYWFPIIWTDRDWDQHYIYEMLKHKLERQAKYIGEKNRHTTAKRDAEKMLLCARLIEIQQEDLYAMEYMDYRESKSFLTIQDALAEDPNEDFTEFFAKYPRQYKKAVSGELSIFRRTTNKKTNKRLYAMEISHENQKRSKRLLFKLIEQNIDRWWD
jgi:hypothetical protein